MMIVKRVPCAPAAPQPQLRRYQIDIADAVEKYGGALIMLPTGSGKTLIAAECFKRRIAAVQAAGQQQQQRRLHLLLVPKCILVPQQAKAVRDWTGAVVGELKGGAAVPDARQFDVLVSTPVALLHAIQREQLPDLEQFSTVVFDEMHHCLKEDPYSQVARRLALLPCEQRPTVVGMTASLTFEVDATKAENAIRKLREDLGVGHFETRTEEQLLADGYAGTSQHVKVSKPPLAVPGVVPESERIPHKALQTFVDRLRDGTATPMATSIDRLLTLMERDIMAAEANDGKGKGGAFEAPRAKKPVSKWGDYANKRGKQQKRGGAARDMYKPLENVYEVARLLITSWEELPDACLWFLDMCGVEDAMASTATATTTTVGRPAGWSADTQHCLRDLLAQGPPPARFEHLRDVLLIEYAQRPTSFRGLVYVQQKVMTHVLAHFISSDEKLACFRAAPLHAATPATPSLRMSMAEGKAVVERFRTGDVNLLVTTVVAEEGLDIPAANCVVRFDPVLTPVSHTQGKGRARQSDSRLTVCAETGGRTTADLAKASERQAAVAARLEPLASPEEIREKRCKEQRNRDINARGVLLGTTATDQSAVVRLNTYCTKTKVRLGEISRRGKFECECALDYVSVTQSVKAKGAGATKKAAREAAAEAILSQLR